MEADTLTTKNSTMLLDCLSVYPDSSTVMLRGWTYNVQTDPHFDTKSWLQGSTFQSTTSLVTGFTRHNGIYRSDKMVSESLLLALLVFETLLVAYLVKNGLKFLNSSIKSTLTSNNSHSGLFAESNQKESQIHEFLWILSIVVFVLFAPLLMHAGSQRFEVDLNAWLFLRLFIYVLIYFSIKYFLIRMISRIFFTVAQKKQWIVSSKTTVSFFAISLTPIMICSEIGVQIPRIYFVIWVGGFWVLSQIWLMIKAINIFSIRFGDFLYLILYLCTLEILPIFLFYKGLFLV